MSVRRGLIWPVVLALVTLLGACAHDPAVEASHIAIRGDEAPAGQSAVAQTGSLESAEIVIATARENERTYALQRSPAVAGYVADSSHSGNSAYRLDTGDRLRIFVYGQPNLSRLYAVDQSGNISVPLIGAVRARGLSTYQLEGAIKGRLARQYVRDPVVNVDVQQNRPFYILGEVRNAGQFPYVTGMTIEMAVATAGGYSERANERTVRLTRRMDGVPRSIDATPDTEIVPGDTIYVYERYF
jgi:protein involved in polysaccharide export with SLBB domain